MNPFLVSLLLLLSPFIFTSCDLSDEPITVDGVILSSIDSVNASMINEMQAQHISGMSIAITKDDAIIFEGHYGLADRESERLITKQTAFLLASVSKLVTGTALMQLHEAGHFQLDDDITNYLPFPVDLPYDDGPITFRMLLTHTASIGDNETVQDEHYYYGEDSPISLADFMEDYFTESGAYYDDYENFTDDAPGTGFTYSNIGTALEGYLVETISGQDFDTYCDNNIFDPLCMANTSWRLAEMDENLLARPYLYDNDYEVYQHYTFTDYPNGGLRATASDMAHFLIMYAQNGSFNNSNLLSSTTVNEMTSLQIPNIASDMGLQWFLLDANEDSWGHDGGEQGTTTLIGYSKSSKVGVVILCNAEDAELQDIFDRLYSYGKRSANPGQIPEC